MRDFVVTVVLVEVLRVHSLIFAKRQTLSEI